MNHNDYLLSLANIDNPVSMNWQGDLFLPPCNCASPLMTRSSTLPMYCTEVQSSKVFDYSSTNKIQSKQFTNLCDYVIPGSKSRTQTGYWLCHKYGLSTLPIETKNKLSKIASTNHQQFTNSKEFQQCLELLRADLNVLTPFNRCKLTMQKNDATHRYIKYIVYCAQSHTYQQRDDRKHKMSATHTRVTETTKPTNLAKKCGFKVNLFF